jgi:glycosyltransferase involved in cell wall biosynthesis
MAQTSIQYCLYPQDRGNISRSMPVKLLESIAYGRPVIGNADTLMGEWIERNKWGYQVPQADPEALAKAIRAAAASLFKDGFSVMRQAPLWSGEGQKLVSVYERLLK